MYTMIKTITMRHSAKRRILRLSISPTSPHREVANRHIQQRAFRRIAPVASCEVDSILLIALCLVNSFKCSSHASAKLSACGSAGALMLDKAQARDIMRIQKGAVDLTVGPNSTQKMC